MYQIDLLNGHAKPRKSSPVNSVLICIFFILPAIMPAVLYAFAQQDVINVIAASNSIEKLDDAIFQHTNSSEISETINARKLMLKKCAREFSDELKLQYQFSDILERLAVLLPKKLLITKIEVLSDIRTISESDPEDQESFILKPGKKWTLVLELKEKGISSLDNSFKRYITLIESDSSLKSIKEIEYKKFTEVDGNRKYYLECDLGLKFTEDQDYVQK